MYGTATSPIGHGDKLILVLDNDANLPNSRVSRSKVVALNKANGDLVWETPRPLQRSSWSTPMLWKYEGGEDLVIFGNGRVYGYHSETGAEKWSSDWILAGSDHQSGSGQRDTSSWYPPKAALPMRTSIPSRSGRRSCSSTKMATKESPVVR